MILNGLSLDGSGSYNSGWRADNCPVYSGTDSEQYSLLGFWFELVQSAAFSGLGQPEHVLSKKKPVSSLHAFL